MAPAGDGGAGAVDGAAAWGVALRAGGDALDGLHAAFLPGEAVGEAVAALAEAGGLRVGDEVRVDRFEREAAVFDCGGDTGGDLRRADDHHVGAAAVGGIGLDPGITERDVGAFCDHVVAGIAGRVLEEAGAPVSVGEVEPVLPARGAVVEGEVRGVPIGRAVRILAAVFDGANVVAGDAQLPGEAVDELRALHVAAEQAEEVGDPFVQHRFLLAQQADRLDEAGNADDRVAAGGGANFLQHFGEIDGVVARAGAFEDLLGRARDAVVEEAVAGRRDDVGDAVDRARGEEVGGDPAYHAAGASFFSERGLVGVADVVRLVAAEARIMVGGLRKAGGGELVFVAGGGGEGAGLCESF